MNSAEPALLVQPSLFPGLVEDFTPEPFSRSQTGKGVHSAKVKRAKTKKPQPAKDAAPENAIDKTTTNLNGTQVVSDHLPPIESLREFTARNIDPPKLTEPICPCSDCGGELAEPSEIEQHRKQHPDWQPQPACTCGDDTDAFHDVMEEARKEWDSAEQQDNLLTVYDWYRRYRCHRHKTTFPKHLKECQDLLEIGDDEFKRLIEEVEKKMAAGDKAEPETADKKTEDPTWKKYTLELISDLATREVDTSQYLLGEGWLERGAGGIIYAGAGIGKSVLSVQAGIKWSAGLMEFNTQPSGPLHITVIQAEDQQNDKIRMAKMFHHLGLTGEQKERVNQNFRILTCSDLTDDRFFKMLDGYLSDNETDLIIINPLQSYIGCDISSNEERVKAWLRGSLDPMLKEYQIGGLIMHHTPKQNYRKTDNWKHTDYMYGMSGIAELTNWPRMIVGIEATEDIEVFCMRAAKRSRQSGWPEVCQYIAYTKEKDLMLWVPASVDQIESSQKEKGSITCDAVVKYLPQNKPMHEDEVVDKAAAEGFSKSSIKTALRQGAERGKIFHAVIRDCNPHKRWGYQILKPLFEMNQHVECAVPLEGILEKELYQVAFNKWSYYKDEVWRTLQWLVAERKVLCFKGEGRYHSTVYLVRATFEKEYRKKHPNAESGKLTAQG